MHPILQRPARLGWYLLAWMPFEAIMAYILATNAGLETRHAIGVAVPLTIYWAIACLAPWNVCRQFPLRGTQPWKLVLVHSAGGVLASLVGVNLLGGAGYLLNAMTGMKPALLVFFELGILWYLVSAAVHYAVLAAEESRKAELLARDAELKALKAQINPHFLFNSLNSISALTAVDPEKAREMCLRLAEFLRATLGLGEKESIPWTDEVQLVRSYLEVEQVRFGSRLKVDFALAETCNGCNVPPLVLQPLVENAVKHGIATLVEGGSIRVEGRAANGMLSVTVENPFDPDSPSSRRNGLGLRNVRERLAARYGGSAKLATTAAEGRFRAEILMPCGGN